MVATVSLFVGIFISDKAVQASGITTPIHDKAVTIALLAYPSDCNSNGYICYYDDTAGKVLLSKTAPQAIYNKSICYSGNYIADAAKAGYISNPTVSDFVVYLNTSCSGTSAPIYAHSSGAMNSQWNNKIRSLVRVAP